MFKLISTKEQFIKERNRNARLQSELEQAAANIDYIAMMTDIELDTETEEITDEQI